MGFSTQEYCSELPFPSPGDLPDPGIKPRSPALQADALTSEVLINAVKEYKQGMGKREDTGKEKEIGEGVRMCSSFKDSIEGSPVFDT